MKRADGVELAPPSQPEWPADTAPGTTARPGFPLEAFPEWLGVYVNDVALSLQVPVDMPAAFALGHLALAAARVGDINPWADHHEPLNLFVALVAPPGGKKSACIKHFSSVVDAFEQDLQQRMGPEVRATELELERLTGELEQAKREGDWAKASELTEQVANAPRPAMPRLSTADTTAQALASLLAEQTCMAVVSAEPTFIPTVMGRWANGKSTTELDVFLQGHAGDTIKVDRRGRPPERVEAPRLTLAVALQPEALRSFTTSETAGRGLLARFLYVVSPDVRGTGRLSAARPIPRDHRHAFERGLRALLEAPKLNVPLALDSQASALWERFHDDFEARIAPGGDLRDLHGWAEKYRGHVARIAGALHLADGRGASKVDLDTLRRAILVGEWLEGHALEAFSMMNLRADVFEASQILEVVRGEEYLEVTRRDLHQKLKVRNAFKKVKDLERGLALLVKRGLLRPMVPAPKPGRPSTTYQVNPRVHSEGFEGVSGGGK